LNFAISDRPEGSREDLQDSPEIGCLEQVAAEAKRRHVDGKMPPAIAGVLATAKAAGTVERVASNRKGGRSRP